MLKKNFFKNKKVLITGHTGFKGSWLAFILYCFGARVYGYSLKAKTKNDNFYLLKLNKKIKNYYYDVRDKLTGRRTRYMHPITATRACPIKTFDECIIGGNTIELPEGSTLGDYSYEIKWTEGGKNYTYKLEVEGLNPIDQEFKKKFIDEVKIRN